MNQFEIMGPLEIHHLLRAAQHHHLHNSPRNKKKKKIKKKRKKKITVPYKVKSGDIKLPSWPTTTAFPAWRRTLRQAVTSASDRPERARPWIFAVESDDIMMDDLACADDDRHRTRDAKVAEALKGRAGEEDGARCRARGAVSGGAQRPPVLPAHLPGVQAH